MSLTPLDWFLIAAYFVFSFGIAVYYFRRAGKDTSEFFLSGRSMPWWLAGTSMVATTFAADTPLAVTELVAQSGIAGNWLWWNFAFGGMLTVFFFARLWRRSGVLTDAFQFLIAISGSIILAVYVLDLPEVGGMAGLMEKLPESTFRILPTIGQAAEGGAVLALSAASFAAYVGMQWWSSWYPGSEPGGGGYVAQRMMSAKDETHSLFATLWFTIAHYCLRPWPWIIVALAALVLYPGLDDPREGFVLVMRDVLPPGLLGLMFAAFLAAFMSTVSTQLNWGTSYLVNDFWRRFINKDGDEKHYVFVSRVLTFALAFLAVFVTANLRSISEAWGLLLTASAELGLVLILRWYWWRVNAWSELAATLSPVALLIVALALSAFDIEVPGLQDPFPTNLFSVTAFTTVVWVTATFVTRPTNRDVLDRFYRKTHPGGPGWKPVAARNPDVRPDTGLGALLLDWTAGVALVYCTLFGVGYLLMNRTGPMLLCFGVVALSGTFLWWDISRRERALGLEMDS
ncbi:MAG: sodium:solute symporter family protein [Rhodothermales bacterium]